MPFMYPNFHCCCHKCPIFNLTGVGWIQYIFSRIVFFRPILISSYPFTRRAVPWLRRLVAGLSLGTGDWGTFQCILCGIYGEQSGTRTCFSCISFHSSFSRRWLILVYECSSRLLALILGTLNKYYIPCLCIYIYIYIYYKVYNTLNKIFVLFILFLWLHSVHIIIVVYSEERGARSSCTKPHGVTSDNIVMVQRTNVIALYLYIIGIKHLCIRNLLKFHTFIKLGDQYYTQTALGYQYYTDRSTLHLVTYITPNAWSLHFIRYLADFMQPALRDWLHASYIWWPVRRWLHVRHTCWPLLPRRHAAYT